MASPQLITEMETKYPNLSVLRYRALAPLQIKLRDEKTTPTEFKFYADRLMRILAEEGLAACASKTETVVTPTGDSFTGLVPAERVCAVSIIRAGDSLLQSIIECDPTISVGKILIQRDEKSEDKHPIMYYSKLPPNVENLDNVLLVDPMLATGGSVNMAIKTLIDSGVAEKKITFLNVISCPEGLAALFNEYPDVKVVTAGLDIGLNGSKYILPGLGDYGDRYYNTVAMDSQQIATEMEAKFPNLRVLKYKALETFLTKTRDKTTTHSQFKHYSDRLMSILAEEGLASCSTKTATVTTPTGDSFTGVIPAESACAVSIIRAGCSLLQAVISCDPTIAVGKILIQRDESSEDKHAVMYYSKLPLNIAMFENVLVVDPMLGTGGTITMAIQTLINAGVDEKRITFLNVLSCPEGLDVLFTAHPNVKVVTAGVDRGLNEDRYLVPGIGDFGDRYFNTVPSHHL